MKETLNAAIKKFGVENQLNVAIEEMSELTKEICKAKRNEGCKLHIAEEIADVEIMLAQLKIIYNCENEVEVYSTQKLARLNRKIEGN